MITPVQDSQAPRIAYFGGRSALSSAVLRRLLEEDCVVSGVVLAEYGPVPREDGAALPVAGTRSAQSVEGLARAADVPVVYVGDVTTQTAADAVAGLAADVGVVTCFPCRVPASLWTLLPHASFNLHPSLLSAYRGPAPLFWQLRHGAANVGVTLHALSDELDAGDVVAQHSLSLRDGLGHAAINERVADVGAGLIRDLLDRLAAGDLQVRAQPIGAESYFPWPVPRDLKLDRRWSARRAFNFVRGVGDRHGSFGVAAAGRAWRVHEVTGFAAHGQLDGGCLEHPDGVSFQFNPGILHARGRAVR